VTWPSTASGRPASAFAASMATSRVPEDFAESSVDGDTTAFSFRPQPGEKYASEERTGSLVTSPVPRSTTAVNAPRVISAGLLVKERGAYTTTARSPEAVTQALPIQASVSNPGSEREAAVFHA